MNCSSPLVLLLCLLAFVQGRIHNRQITVSEIRRSKGWMFLDRMSFDQGMGSVELTLKLQSPTDPEKSLISLDLAMIPDELWLQEQAFKCGHKIQKNDKTVVKIDLAKEKKYSETVNMQFKIEHPKNYHFVLRDCDNAIAYQYFRRESKIILNLDMKNGDYDHGSDEHVNKFMLPFLLILTVLMIYFSKAPKNNEFGGERDWAKLILFITLIFNFIALLFNYLGFLLYLWTGSNYGFFDFTYLLFHAISQSMLTTLIIFIAFGWTITFTSDAEFDLYIPLISMLGLINLILTLLGKINDGDSDKYHMYDTIPSYLLVFFRVVTVIVFAVGIIRLYLQNRKNNAVISFLANFAFMGGIYFLSLPGIMLMATLLPISTRKQVVFLSVQIIKNTINVILTYMISSKNSKYKGIQQTNQSFFQTGNKVL